MIKSRTKQNQQNNEKINLRHKFQTRSRKQKVCASQYSSHTHLNLRNRHPLDSRGAPVISSKLEKTRRELLQSLFFILEVSATLGDARIFLHELTVTVFGWYLVRMTVHRLEGGSTYYCLDEGLVPFPDSEKCPSELA
jgi:hypothetical protein